MRARERGNTVPKRQREFAGAADIARGKPDKPGNHRKDVLDPVRQLPPDELARFFRLLAFGVVIGGADQAQKYSTIIEMRISGIGDPPPDPVPAQQPVIGMKRLLGGIGVRMISLTRARSSG